MPVDYKVAASNIASLRCYHSIGATWANLLANTGGTVFVGLDNATYNYETYKCGTTGAVSNWAEIYRTYMEFDLAAYTAVTIDNAYIRVVVNGSYGRTDADLASHPGYRLNFVSSPDVHVGGITSADWTDPALGSTRFAETDKAINAGSSRRVLYFKLSAAGLAQLQSDAAAGGKFRLQMRSAADIDGTTTGLLQGASYTTNIPTGDSGAGGVVYSDVPQLVLDMDQAEAFNLRDSIAYAWNCEESPYGLVPPVIQNDEGANGNLTYSGQIPTVVDGPYRTPTRRVFGYGLKVGTVGTGSSSIFSAYDINESLPVTIAGWFNVYQATGGNPKALSWSDSSSTLSTKARVIPFESVTVRDYSTAGERVIQFTGDTATGDAEDLPPDSDHLYAWVPWVLRINANGLAEYKIGGSPWMFDNRGSNFVTSPFAYNFLGGLNRLIVGETNNTQTMRIDHVMIWTRALNDTEVRMLLGSNGIGDYSVSDAQAWPFGLLHADMSVTAQELYGEADPGALTIAGTDPEIGIVAATAAIDAQAAGIPEVSPALVTLDGSSAGAAEPDPGAVTIVGVTGDDAFFVPALMTLSAQLFASEDTLDPGALTITAQVIPSDLDWCPDYNPSLPGGGYPDDCDLNLEAQLIDMTVDAGTMTLAAQAVPGGDVNPADLTIVGVLQDGQDLYPSLLAFVAPRIVDIDFYRVYITDEALTGNVGTATQFMLDERTTSPFTGTLTNELSTTVLKTELDAVQLVVYDKKQKVVLRETRDALEFVQANGSVDWLLTPHVTSLVNPDVPDSALLTHVAVWEFCWGSHVIDTASIGFATVLDSRTVTVTHPAHGFQVENHVIFKGAPEVGGLEMDGVFVVTSVLGGDQYTVDHINKATSSASETRLTEYYWNPMTTKHAFEFVVRKREVQ